MIQSVDGLQTALPENLEPFPALARGVTVGIPDVASTDVAVGKRMAPVGRRPGAVEPEREIARALE
jgi:hypothetical protein